MNYIELINQFWKTRRSVKFSSNESDLYYFLLQESNSRSWENPFECSNGLICASIGLTEKTLIDVRNRLQQKGLIEFEAGQKKRKSPVYTLLYCKNVSITASITGSKTVGITGSKTVNSLINKTETKQDNTLLLEKEAKATALKNQELEDKVKELEQRLNEGKEKSSAKKEKSDFRSALINLGADPKFLDDWIDFRSKRKSGFSKSALEAMVRESKSAGISVAEAVQICAERSWKGFRASYVADSPKMGNISNTAQQPQPSKMQHNYSELQKAKMLNEQINNHQQ